MAFIRKCIFIILFHLLSLFDLSAQPVYYPARSSRLLKSTVQDAAMLFQKAISNSQFTPLEYAAMPSTGIIFIYDSTLTDNQLCKVESNGSSFIKFTAAQDNGLIFGFYQYIDELGFRFYQPGSIWEITPTLNSPYKLLNKNYSNAFIYRNWVISGGHRRWLMDNNPDYTWDVYSGEHGHNWALYQRRNGMQGAYGFHGHRGDIMSGNYLTTLQNNPCYVACYNETRQATTRSIPDINKLAAMDLWANTIEQKYTQYKNIVYGNQVLYADLYRNFDYGNKYIGIEVPDGPRWGNSIDNSGCSSVAYPTPSDQNFTLSNHTAQKISAIHPGKHLQVYAYSSHADVPSAGIILNNKIDIQVVSTAFQSETSSKGLLNRWYNRTTNISEYHYLNIPQWGGETPMFYLNDLKNTMARLKQKNSQGIIWEASPAKFASLPFLWAANRNLLGTTPIDSSLKEFTNAMFGPASQEIYKLLQQWSNDNTVTMGGFIGDNKYKIPIYLQLLNEAVIKTQNSSGIIKQRIRELKAYLHYMILYYDWVFYQRGNAEKADKAAALCLYLAKISKMQIVNSYFLIIDIVNRFPAASSFYSTYNVFTGTAYLYGNLPLISNEEIDADYLSDLSEKAGSIPAYDIKDPVFIAGKMAANNITSLEKVNIKIGYTNGADYPNRSEFFIYAKSAGNFEINYIPQFNMRGKGQINFTVEAADKPLEILKDITLNQSSPTGKFTVSLPTAGTYKLTIVSKYQTSVSLTINTNGNIFYKNTAFLGNKTENYRSDLNSLPGYYYVPAGMQRIYFSVNNGFGVTIQDLSKAFSFRDNNGNIVEPQRPGNNDSALFYINVPAGQSGTFWQVFKMEQYNLCFANISNVQWYVKRKDCNNADIKISVIKKGDNCITHLSTSANVGSLKWEVYDSGNWTFYTNSSEVDLPDYVSPNAIISLYNGPGCMSTKRLADHPDYYTLKQSCAIGAPLPELSLVPSIRPNPSSGIYYIIRDGALTPADELIILNSLGMKIMAVQKTSQVNITSQPAGIYLYKLRLDQHIYSGKLVKL